MKLLTEISGNDDDVILVCNGDIDVSGDDQLEHDAACAHALMLATRQYGSEFPLSAAAPQDVIQWVEKRASEIMAGWGFDSGEVEGER